MEGNLVDVYKVHMMCQKAVCTKIHEYLCILPVLAIEDIDGNRLLNQKQVVDSFSFA